MNMTAEPKNRVVVVVDGIVQLMGTKTAVLAVTALIAALTGSTGFMASQVSDGDTRLQGGDVALRSALDALTRSAPPPPAYLLEDCPLPRRTKAKALLKTLERCNADKAALRRYYAPAKQT
jgi:hypothetical protein